MIRSRSLPFLALASVCAAVSCAGVSVAASPLDRVVEVLPDIPLVVQGDLQRRDSNSKVVLTRRVEMVLDWKADIPTARYTIRDAFGDSLQHLAITWNNRTDPEYQYFEGNPLHAAAMPPLNSTIQDTDITWLDLSLSFLWWEGGELRGQESVRGRKCDVIDVAAPAGKVSGLDGVRLWIETNIGIVLRAEGYDTDGQLIRRMDVKSFKKIRGRWVIKDIEFESFPQHTKTSLRVRDVTERERFELPDRDTRPDGSAAGDGIASPVGEPIDVQ